MFFILISKLILRNCLNNFDKFAETHSENCKQMFSNFLIVPEILINIHEFMNSFYIKYFYYKIYLNNFSLNPYTISQIIKKELLVQ